MCDLLSLSLPPCLRLKFSWAWGTKNTVHSSLFLKEFNTCTYFNQIHTPFLAPQFLPCSTAPIFPCFMSSLPPHLNLLTNTVLPVCSWVLGCMAVHGCAQVCTGVHKCGTVCQRLSSWPQAASLGETDSSKTILGPLLPQLPTKKSRLLFNSQTRLYQSPSKSTGSTKSVLLHVKHTIT